MTNETRVNLVILVAVLGLGVGLVRQVAGPQIVQGQTKTAVTGQLTLFTATIANGASLSDAQGLEGDVPVGLIMPASWTAAGITYQCSNDNQTFTDLYDDSGTEIVTVATASKTITLTPGFFGNCRWVKIRSGTGGVPVNQGAARTIGVSARR